MRWYPLLQINNHLFNLQMNDSHETGNNKDGWWKQTYETQVTRFALLFNNFHNSFIFLLDTTMLTIAFCNFWKGE